MCTFLLTCNLFLYRGGWVVYILTELGIPTDFYILTELYILTDL